MFTQNPEIKKKFSKYKAKTKQKALKHVEIMNDFFVSSPALSCSGKNNFQKVS